MHIQIHHSRENIKSLPAYAAAVVKAVVNEYNSFKETCNNNASFGYNEDQIVSSDVIGMNFGSLFDSTQTMVTKVSEGLYQVQVVAWYDNENSYTSQMVRTIKYFSENC